MRRTGRRRGRRRHFAGRAGRDVDEDHVLTDLYYTAERDKYCLILAEKTAFPARSDDPERGLMLDGNYHIHDMTQPRPVCGVYNFFFPEFAKGNLSVHNISYMPRAGKALLICAQFAELPLFGSFGNNRAPK